jgi:hypothetical protein
LTRPPESRATATRIRILVLCALAAVAVAVGSALAGREGQPSPQATPPPARTGGRPGLVYVPSRGSSDRPRLQGSWIATAAAITLANDKRVRSVTFLVDEDAGAAEVFAVDRKAPFTLPRRGRGATPYAIGPHTLRTDVELRTGKHLRLKVAYTVARILLVPATVDAESLERSIGAVPQGELLVRPADGETSFTVTGEMHLDRELVTIERAHMSGGIEFEPGASGSRLVGSSALGFNIFGADNVVVSGNSFDGRGIDSQNIIWDQPAGNTPDGWRVVGNTFQNFYIDDGDTHSEALFIGYSTRGLIERNTFTNNGNTAHIFFSWWGGTADPRTSYPRDICVRGNTFNQTHDATSDVNFRDEIPATAHIAIQRDASNTNETFYGSC